MQTLKLSDTQVQSIEQARDAAVARARDSLQEPVVLSWRDDRRDVIAPEIPGATTEDRWREYGGSNGGQIEIDVGDEYHFILGDAADFTEAESRFANLTDGSGNSYFCVREACTEEDRRRLGEGWGGGIGGGTS